LSRRPLPLSDDPQVNERRERDREKRARFKEKNPNYFRDQARKKYAILKAKDPDYFRRKRREEYLKNPEEMRRKKREAHHKNPMVSRRVTLKKLYGITPEDYDKMLAAQNFACGICGTRNLASKGTKFGHVDHDHSKQKGDDGFVRGILCQDCNMGAGRYHDDPILLRKAADWYANWRGLGISVDGLKIESWSSNQNHEEHHFFLPANEHGYQSSQYVLGYNPKLISDAKLQRIMAIVSEPDEPSTASHALDRAGC
jgi:Recombination endonuclease VII